MSAKFPRGGSRTFFSQKSISTFLFICENIVHDNFIIIITIIFFFQNSFWHFALAGDRSALLKYENSEVTLSIWKYETLPNGERKRVMDKIMYGN